MANTLCKAKLCADGTFDKALGTCTCPFVSSCNITCQKTRPLVMVTRGKDNKLRVKFADRSSGVYVSIPIPNEIGISDNDHDDHPAEMLSYGSDGITGVLVKNVEEAKSLQVNGDRKRRDVGNQETFDRVQNPTFCLEYGSSLVFKIEINANNRSLSHYPRYRKNHLFNNNTGFDYGSFQRLHLLVQESNQTLQYFAYVFKSEGVMAFYDNAEPLRETYVRVVRRGMACPEGSRMDAANTALFTELGMKQAEVRGLCLYGKDYVRACVRARSYA